MPGPEREDLEWFYREQFPRVFGAVALYCGDSAIAEEIAQEALLRAVTAWPTVRRKDNPAAWVHRVAINLANSHFRRRAAEKRALRRVAQSWEHDVLAPQEGHVMAAVSELPKRLKTALILRYYLGYSTNEAADLMDCSERTVKRLLLQSKRAIRPMLDAYELETNETELGQQGGF